MKKKLPKAQKLPSGTWRCQVMVDGKRVSVVAETPGDAQAKAVALKAGLIEQTNYGYIVETEDYRYCLRCNPLPGDYQAYLACFDKRVQELNQAREPDMTEDSPAEGQDSAEEQTRGASPVMGGM